MSFLEGRLAEQSTILQSIQQATTSLDGRTQQSIASLDQRMQQGFASVDARLASLDSRMQQGFAAWDQRFRDIDTRMSSQFHWLVGLFVGSFLTTIIGFIGIVMTLLER